MIQPFSSLNIIGLIVFWIGLGDHYRRIPAAYIQDDELRRGDAIYDDDDYDDDDDDMDNRRLVVENEHHPRQAERFEAREIQNLSLWEEEYDVWGSMHLEKELGSGWTPASYPNPEFDPDSCGISPLMRGNSGSVDLLNMYLCDPDKVVNDQDFGRISAALRNFTASNDRVQDIDEPKKRFHREYDYEDTNYKSLRGLVSPQANTSLESVDTDDSLLQNIDENYYRHLLATTNNESIYITRSPDTTLDESHKAYFEGLPNDEHPRYVANKEDDPSLGSFLPLSPNIPPDVSVGVAIAQKIDVTDILREYSFYSFENEVETIDDAAEYFARYLLNLWWRSDTPRNAHYDGAAGNDKASRHSKFNRADSGVLIFISIEERVCFISAGSDVSYILPWWRLEDIVNGMKTNLRNGNYADALLSAINEISAMLESGPPTASERAHDFITRFGFVIAFSMLTFILALGGEYRDRRSRLSDAENRSRLNSIELEKAKLLQFEFKAIECPICLEPFINEGSKLVGADKYGIPIYGSDGLKIKILRCGHIFDLSCWRAWIDADYSNANKCPVCRQDVAGLDDEFNSIHSNRSSYMLSFDSNNSIFASGFADVSMSASDFADVSISASDSADNSISASSSSEIFAHYSGREYETSTDIPIQSYGSTWTSSENRDLDPILPY